MSTYLTYMKAFGTDLGHIAVWEPGRSLDVGDYGSIQNGHWNRLGSIWELSEHVTERMREVSISKLDRLSLGSAQITSGTSDTRLQVPGGKVALSIRFSGDCSVFVRAVQCETRSLLRIQEIADVLAAQGVWQKEWTFINELRIAQRFLVLVGSGAQGELQVLDSFIGGTATTTHEVGFSGAEVLQFVGRSGPIHMSLTKITGPGWFSRRAKAGRVEFAEGIRSIEPVYLEPVGALDFLENIAGH
jgi:hypothetical protein